jgi:hypothetical protein
MGKVRNIARKIKKLFERTRPKVGVEYRARSSSGFQLTSPEEIDRAMRFGHRTGPPHLWVVTVERVSKDDVFVTSRTGGFEHRIPLELFTANFQPYQQRRVGIHNIGPSSYDLKRLREQGASVVVHRGHDKRKER